MNPAKWKNFIGQIKFNCNISDASYGGNLSLCNMLLRLRQLYYREHHLKPWEKAENEKIIQWIGERESLWNECEELEFKDLQINNKKFNPFDEKGINRQIEKLGYVYGAGYAIFGKPQFFLAKLEKKASKNGANVYYLGQEVCSDLMPSFSISQNDNVYLRRESLIDFLFYKFRDRKSGSALDKAFASFGLNQRTKKANYGELFEKIADYSGQLFIEHELSEIKTQTDTWFEILSSGLDKKMELFVRSVKDASADFEDNGTLSHLTQNQEDILIMFFSAFMNEWYKTIIPDMAEKIQTFYLHHDYALVENERVKTVSYLKKIKKQISDSFEKKGITGIKLCMDSILPAH